LKIRFGILVGFIFFTIFLSVYAFQIIGSEYSYTELDINQSGFVSVNEAFYFVSEGKRYIVVDGKECVETYSLKDGMPLNTVCNLRAH